MNITPRFHLVRKHSITPTAIQARIRYNKKILVYGTGISLFPHLWDIDNQEPIVNKKVLSKNPSYTYQARTATTRIDNIKLEINKFIWHCEAEGLQFTLNGLKDHLDKVFKAEKVATSKRKEMLNEYIERYIDEMEKGIRTNDKGNRFTLGTIKNYKGFQNQFKNY